MDPPALSVAEDDLISLGVEQSSRLEPVEQSPVVVIKDVIDDAIVIAKEVKDDRRVPSRLLGGDVQSSLNCFRKNIDGDKRHHFPPIVFFNVLFLFYIVYIIFPFSAGFLPKIHKSDQITYQ
jgi:hypothetical protein